MIVNINSIIANNDIADGNGSLWYVLDQTGWDSPRVRQSSLDIPSKHGQVTTEGLYGSRDIQVTGLCKAISEAAFYTSWYHLTAETNFLKRTTFVYSVEEDVTRRCNVIRNGQIRMRHIGVNSFDFDLLMRADDPFKYSNALNSEAFVASVPEALTNAGNARTYPIITLNGTGTPTITAGALTFTASGSIPSGAVIDMKNQTVLSGTTSYFDKFDPTSEWLFLEPGSNTVESDVPMTVTWRDAWV